MSGVRNRQTNAVVSTRWNADIFASHATLRPSCIVYIVLFAAVVLRPAIITVALAANTDAMITAVVLAALFFGAVGVRPTLIAVALASGVVASAIAIADPRITGRTRFFQAGFAGVRREAFAGIVLFVAGALGGASAVVRAVADVTVRALVALGTNFFATVESLVTLEALANSAWQARGFGVVGLRDAVAIATAVTGDAVVLVAWTATLARTVLGRAAVAVEIILALTFAGLSVALSVARTAQH